GLDDCGQLVWIYDHPERLEGDLAATPAGLIVTGEPLAGALVAVRADGQLAWRTVLGQAPVGLAVTGSGDIIATTGAGGRLALLEASSGRVRAQANLGGRVGAPLVLGDSSVVIAATPAVDPTGGRLIALEPGALRGRWRATLRGPGPPLPSPTPRP